MQTDTTSNLIPLSEPFIGTLEREWINRCLDSGFVSTAGHMVSDFEIRFAQKVGVPYAVATSSGTTALTVALRLAGVTQDDLVAVQDLTFVASVNPILQHKAAPLLVDIDPARWTMDIALLERFLEANPQQAERLKAVVPVHLYGCTVDMTHLMRLAERFNFRIVEDATEALGSTIHGKQVGTFGDLGCFSFNGNKMMTTGSGGMIVTRSAELAEQARYLVAQAREPGPAYLHGTDGYNYRMPSLNAALGLAQLEQLDELIARKQQIAQAYRAALSEQKSITLPPEKAGVYNCHWLSSVLADSPAHAEALMEGLNREQIMARPFFLPLHKQPYLQQAQTLFDGHWNSADIASRGINLPSSAGMTSNQQRTVIDRLLTLLRH